MKRPVTAKIIPLFRETPLVDCGRYWRQGDVNSLSMGFLSAKLPAHRGVAEHYPLKIRCAQ
jgi:hypothetical protein